MHTKKTQNVTEFIVYKCCRKDDIHMRLYYTCINFLTVAVSKPVGMKRKSRTSNYTAAFFQKQTAFKIHLEMCS